MPKHGILLPLILAVCGAFPASAQPIDIDFDFLVRVVDEYFTTLQPGAVPTLTDADRDGNGIRDTDTFGMLQAVLLANSPNLPSGISSVVRSGYTGNLSTVITKFNLQVINQSGSHTFHLINQIGFDAGLYSYAFQHVLTAYLTVADQATLVFINAWVDQVVRAVLTDRGYAPYFGLFDPDALVGFGADEFATFGDAPGQPNYFGAAGNIDSWSDPFTNIAEYQVASGPFRREQWLNTCNLRPPLRVVSGPFGGNVLSGDAFTFFVTAAGGSGTYHYQWLRTDGNGLVYPFTFETVGGDTSRHEISYALPSDEGRYLVAVSDNVSQFNLNEFRGGRISAIARFRARAAALHVTVNPIGAYTAVGRTYDLVCQVKGGAVIPQFQWYKNGQPAGPATPIWTLGPISFADAADYFCIVTAGLETVQTDTATLQVIPQGGEVVFPDPSLNALIRTTLGFNSTQTIREGDLVPIFVLDGRQFGIANLSGLQYCINLEKLDLWTNSITDISPISALTELVDLRLGRNNISNLDAITPLVNLEILYLWDNPITSISALLANPGLGAGDQIGLEGIALPQSVLCDEIPQLKARGAQVTYDGLCIILPEGEGEGAMEGEGEGLPITCDMVVASSDTPKNLSNSVPTISHIDVPIDGTIEDVNVIVNITHPLPSFVAAQVISPAGTSVALFLRPSIPGPNYSNTVFNDETLDNLNQGKPPYSGSFKPLTPLSALDGEAMAGRWTLSLTNASGAGTVNFWSLQFNPCVKEVTPCPYSSADTSRDRLIGLPELLRLIQIFNSGRYHCKPGSEDGFAPGFGSTQCPPHTSDYNPQDWSITLTELLRLIQFYNSVNGQYHCADTAEDGYRPGPPL